MKVLGVFFALVAIAKSASVPLYLSSPSATTLLRSAPLWDTSYVTSGHVGPAFAYSALNANAYSPYYSVIPTSYSYPSYRHVVYVQPEPRYITVEPPTLVQELGKAPVITHGITHERPTVDSIVPVEVESPADNVQDDVEKVSVDEDTVSVETA